MNKEIKIFYTKDAFAYELLDTGEGEKLERVGKYTFVRPFEGAVWPKTLSKKEWAEVAGKFFSSKGGTKAGWKMNTKIEKEWLISYKGINFWVQPTAFRHFGFFPEQASHWDFIEKKIKQAYTKRSSENFGAGLAEHGARNRGPEKILPNSSPVKFLNLFGYTGVASLFALRAGAEVTHLDASKQSLDWAKKNQIASGLENLFMRIICDDALKFLEREAKRGNKYDAVIMDPPKFGRGPKGEIWKLEDMLPKLLEGVKKVLSDKPLFVILTSYAVDASSLSLGYALEEMMHDFRGKVENGELCIKEKAQSRLISLANTAIWQKD